MRLGAIVQARSGSTRLPNKILLKLVDKTVLQHVINRLKLSKYLDKIIIATTTNLEDDKIFNLCNENRIDVHRGSEQNVLERYYDTAQKYNLDTIVRVTSDCPLIDAKVLDKVIELHLSNDYVITTNAGIDNKQRTFPRGLDVEIFDFNHLKKAKENATKNYELEHVTPYIYEYFKSDIGYLKNDVDYSNHRWTLDTLEDFHLISKIYDFLYFVDNPFFMEDIIQLMNEKPELLSINNKVQQKEFNFN